MLKHTRWGLTGLLLAAAPAAAQTINFDFGNFNAQTADVGWNNLPVPAPDPVPNLNVVVDDNGDVVAGVTLEMTDQFFINGPPSQLGSESPSGDAAGFPVSATDDYFFGQTGAFAGGPSSPTGGFKLTGLDPTATYDFTFFSARNGVSDNRETQFDVTGTNAAGGVIATSNNDTNVLLLADIAPDASNEINVLVQAGPNNINSLQFYYINLMQVTANPIPEPASLSLFGLGAMALRRRR